ncbi:AAA family ATPase [Microbacterium testaceum]|uniref:AAA family ATPase n=1 Tax=Microbacterium testaceum TaxID=2033 RepID=UPI001249157E|nr:SMC family ATPase [Microbacterium testaceum]
MKLHNLTLEGFGPFLEAQTVDFDAFTADGIFLITGRTGAGKSSVLDGVCYALYGGVPRYDGAERRLRSDHCEPEDPTRVTLEFSAEGERWRITRSPEFERPKRRGGGTTKEPHRAVLEVLAPEGWTGVAARPVDVAARLDEILGLTQQQFLQVILLAQNRFARFLLAKNDERLSLLRTLFGTRSFEQYAAELDERRKAAAERLAVEGVEVATLLDEAERLAAELSEGDSTGVEGEVADDERPTTAAPLSVSERLARIVRAVERADYRVENAAREREEGDARLDRALVAQREATTLHERQRDRIRLRERLAALDAGEAQIVAAREEARCAAEAETIRAAMDAAETARKALESARRVADAAEERAGRLSEPSMTGSAVERSETTAEHAVSAGDGPVDRTLLVARDDDLTALLARAESALEAEIELGDVQSERDRLAAVVARTTTDRDALVEGRAEVPELLRTLDERLAQLAGAETRRATAATTRDDLRRRREAARRAARLQEERDQADLASLVRADEVQRAVDVWTGLLRRRLAGAAVELAHDLVDGEPCAVCGAREHPAPARGDADPVTDDELTAAEDRKNAAVEQDRLASDAARVARDAHALAAALAGGESVDTLEARLGETEQALEAAEAEVADLESVRAERTRAVDLDAAIAERIEGLTSTLASARQDLALAEQEATRLRSAVAAARGEFESVAARRRDLQSRRDAIRELVAARDALESATTHDLETRSTVAALVDESSFPDTDAVRQALRPIGDRRRLDAAIAEHDAAVASVRQRLLELELLLVDAPDEPVDPAPYAEAVARAREDVQRATAAHASARGLADRLRGLAQRADAGHASVAALSDEHAVIARLADTVSGRAPNTRRMTLETFVLAAELEEIVTAANLRLDHMSSGRYRLQHTDALAARGAASGLGLEVLDAFTGQSRPPQSLSGGETFLTSLALALGLAEVVTARAGGIRLDTLFIDEGFGSLDDETLDLAMRTLDELRQGGRTVGVISHVAAMKDQLPAQLRVTATPRGPSVIRQDAPALAG